MPQWKRAKTSHRSPELRPLRWTRFATMWRRHCYRRGIARVLCAKRKVQARRARLHTTSISKMENATRSWTHPDGLDTAATKKFRARVTTDAPRCHVLRILLVPQSCPRPPRNFKLAGTGAYRTNKRKRRSRTRRPGLPGPGRLPQGSHLAAFIASVHLCVDSIRGTLAAIRPSGESHWPLSVSETRWDVSDG
jgi:hypothetical protein